VPAALGILQNQSLHKKPKQTKLTAFDIHIQLKTPKEAVDHAVFKEQIIDETCNVLLEHSATFKASPGFPEMIIPVTVSLKRIAKGIKAGHLRQKVLEVVR
jgi:hypothetical protein